LSGIQEILLIVLIVVVIWLLPRLVNRSGGEEKAGAAPFRLGGRARLALLASGVWIAAAALLWSPWEGDPLRFLFVGLGPPALGWGAAWVVLGFRKGR
jgi:hypothetical protein